MMKMGPLVKRITYLLLGFTVVAMAVGQDKPTSPAKIAVVPGTVLRSALDKGLRIRRGKAITASLIEPVYIGKTLVIPAGSTLRGDITSTRAVSGGRVQRLLSGDFTPLREADVLFNELILPDGTRLPICTLTGLTRGVQVARFVPKFARPKVTQQIDDAITGPFREPNKLQRLNEAFVTSLPYHPEFLDTGTVFTSTVVTALKVPLPVQPSDSAALSADSRLLHTRLLTPLNSGEAAEGMRVKGIVSQPYYDVEQKLTLPAGTKLEGRVNKVTPAGSLKKNGSLLVTFDSAEMPDGGRAKLHITVSEVQAACDQSLAVDQDGMVRAKTSRFGQGMAIASLLAPTESSADPAENKTAYTRGTQGNNGFGLLGAGAAQATSSVAYALGYYAAAKAIYGAFLAPGTNVALPVETPIVLRSDADTLEDSFYPAKPSASVAWVDHQVEVQKKVFNDINTGLRSAWQTRLSCRLSSRGLPVCSKS